ncbi:HNH endonuclease, partial [Patescibacteria group bacterium]|nr:HNH endonuclease [Patescibacteria group bacterium]
NKCGISDKRVLVVHHIDGNRKSNSIKNLERLCCNCHAIAHV